MIRVVLVRPAQPRNIGAVVRAAANFGAESVRLVAPQNWDAEAERAARVAASGGWEQVLVKMHDALPDALVGVDVVVGTSARNREHATVPSLPDKLFSRIGNDSMVAILFGTESQGLLKADLDLCHEWIKLATSEDFPSLNVAQAVLLVLYEYARVRLGGVTEKSVASFATREMQEAWLAKIGTDDSRIVQHLRQLLYRAKPTIEEMAALFDVVNDRS